MTKKKEDPKARLAAAFVTIASEKGVDQITLEAVAKKARVPFSTAHYQLRTMGLSIIEFGLRSVGTHGQEFTRNYLERRAREAPAENPLEQYLEGTFAWFKEFRPYANIWLFQYHAIAVNPQLRAIHQTFLDTAIVRIEKLIFESVGKGFYPEWSRRETKIPVSEVAIAVHSILMGGTTRALVSTRGSPEIGDPGDFHLRVTLRAVAAMMKSLQQTSKT